MNTTIRSLALSAGLILACAFGSAQAAVITIDFESDTPGAKGNPFTSVDAAGVHFSDSINADLQVGDFGNQSDGQALAVFGDDPSILQIALDFEAKGISLDFGNDDPCCSNPGDVALLTLFLGAVQIDQVSVVMNRNDLMDQTISYFGKHFDNATFAYADPNGRPINLIEAVDNIVIQTPAPGTTALLGLGLMGLGLRRRTRKASS